MKTKIVLVAAAFLLMTGCSPRHIPLSDPDSISSANRSLKSAQATVRFRDGRSTVATGVEFGEDDVSWDNLWSGERVSVPVSDVKNVELSRTDKGLLRLMMYGLATNYSFAAHLPIFNAVVFLGVPIWIMIGPPAFMAVCDVYDVDYGSYDPEGTLAIPDDGGQLHTVEQPLRPIEAREGARRDVALWLAEKDPRVWESDIQAKDPEVEADLRDTLTLAFPKPESATTAKLVVNGCNSLWCSQMLRRFLELNGYRAKDLLERLDDPSTLEAVTDFFYREEFFYLKVKVWVDGEWVERGRIMGGGPFISEDRVVLIDVADIMGSELRVRLVPPAGLWRFDWFAVDYSEDRPFHLEEVAATSIEGEDGEDLCEVLDVSDGAYHIMPEVGQRALLTFPVPPARRGLERTVFAKVAGYYDIHLHASGRPRSHIVARILEEPGFVVSYSLSEYRDWRDRLHSEAPSVR